MSRLGIPQPKWHLDAMKIGVIGATLTIALISCSSTPKDVYSSGTIKPWRVENTNPIPLHNGLLGQQFADAAALKVNGYGPIQVDLAVGEQQADGTIGGTPMVIAGTPFNNGLGVHADSSIVFPLNGDCTVFAARVGVDDMGLSSAPNGGKGGTVEFEVLVDDQISFGPQRMQWGELGKVAMVSLKPENKKLTLKVTDAGDGIGWDHANWADAYVECKTGTPAPNPTPAPSPVTNISYSESLENFRNPERGETIGYQPGGAADGLPGNPAPLSVSGVRDYLQRQSAALPSSMVRLVYVLGEWKDVSISQDFLNRFASDLAVARELGLKVVPYFAYTWPYDEAVGFDAPKDRILAHLDQLKSIFESNADVIAFVNAGFIGPWGEWHHSSNGNLTASDGVNDNTRAIMNKLLEVIPSTRMIALRYPGLKYQFFDKNPLSASEAFSQSARSRIGFHNECYMADYHPDVRAIRLADREFLKQDGLYVPQLEMMDTGCFDFPFAVWKAVPCSDLLDEMSITHTDAINEFPTNRIIGDCMPEVKRRVGYRYRMLSSQVPQAISAGAGLSVNVNMTNDGFGGLYNPRVLEIVLREKATGRVTRLNVNTPQDTRLFLPAPGQTKNLELNTTVPSGLASGQYDVLLALPDPTSSLHDRPEYAIQLANQSVWEPGTGFNSLNQILEIR